MKSPVGDHKTLQRVELEDGLIAFRCPDTGGHYIPAVSYMRWLDHQPARLPRAEIPGATSQDEPESPEIPAYICPESGTLMSRYKVGHGFRFTIDRSITGGIWLDAGEWEALRERNFHDEINLVFTQPWQREIRHQHSQETGRELMKSKIGGEFLDRLEALKAEISQHPHKALILAYLINR